MMREAKHAEDAFETATSISPASCAARATNSLTFGPKAGGRSSSFRTALQGGTT